MSDQRIVSGIRLAEILDVRPGTVRAWRKAALIPSIKIGGTTLRYDVGEVITSLKSNGGRSLERVTA